MWRRDLKRALERSGVRAPGATAGWAVVAVLAVVIAAAWLGLFPGGGSSEEIVAGLPPTESALGTSTSTTGRDQSTAPAAADAAAVESLPTGGLDRDVLVPAVPQTLPSRAVSTATVAPATVAPARVTPATAAPTAPPATAPPTTPAPATAPPTTAPTTTPPTTAPSTTAPPTTPAPTTALPVTKPPETTLPPETLPPETRPPDATEPPPTTTESPTTTEPPPPTTTITEPPSTTTTVDFWCSIFPNLRRCN